MKTWQALLASSITALTLTACGSQSAEQQSAEQTAETAKNIDPIEAGHEAMHDYDSAMQIMGNMIENPDKFDLAKFQEEAKFLSENSDQPWQYFADKQNNESFQAEIDQFKTATAELNKIAQTATNVEDVKAAFAAVGATCKSCHMSGSGN